MESLQEDLEYIEKLLSLPPAYQVMLKVLASNQKEIMKNKRASTNPEREGSDSMRANISKRDRTYKEYMSDLSKFELDLLYTALYRDFSILGYDPCEGL